MGFMPDSGQLVLTTLGRRNGGKIKLCLKQPIAVARSHLTQASFPASFEALVPAFSGCNPNSHILNS
jgi:hypothetical protein